MGIRGEIFTKPVQAHNRTYFFNVKENTRSDIFLQIVESKDLDNSGFERHSIVVFEDELEIFLDGLKECLNFIEKNRKKNVKLRFKKMQEKKNQEKKTSNTFKNPKLSGKTNFKENYDKKNNQAALYKKPRRNNKHKVVKVKLKRK